jgi:hypothetical protein
MEKSILVPRRVMRKQEEEEQQRLEWRYFELQLWKEQLADANEGVLLVL